MLAIALQTFLSHTPLVEVEVVEVVVKIVHCVKYFISYAVYSVGKTNLTSLTVMTRSTFKHSLIVVIKSYTPDKFRM